MAKTHLLNSVEASNGHGIVFIFECGLTTQPSHGISFTNDIVILENRPPDTVCKKCLQAGVKIERGE